MKLHIEKNFTIEKSDASLKGEHMKKVLGSVAAVVMLLAITACGVGEVEVAPTHPLASTDMSTATITSPLTGSEVPSSTESVLDEPIAEPAPEPTPAPVVEESVMNEVYVVECLVGTPGPSLMSDGTIQPTDYCFELLGGSTYAEEESKSGYIDPATVPYADGGTCPAYKCGYGHNEAGERNPTSGEIQTLHGCQDGYITDSELCNAVAWVETHEY